MNYKDPTKICDQEIIGKILPLKKERKIKPSKTENQKTKFQTKEMFGFLEN